MSDVWFCDGCKEEFDAEEKALEHEKNCPEAVEFVKNAKKAEEKERKLKEKERKLKEEAEERERKLKEEADAEERRLRKEQEKRRRVEELFLKNKLLEEENELGSFTYASRHSENRFPYHVWLISVIITIAYVILGLGILGFLIALTDGDPFIGFLILLSSVIAAFFTMIVGEMIILLLDFHDNNYINTKIRVKTLEALETIRDKLKK